MAVRYTGDVSSEPALYLTDATAQIASTTNLMGRLSTLLRWSQADPVDASEQLRNDRVYSYQTNRNPFVDHPEWVAAAFIPTLSIAQDAHAITLTWTNEAPAMSAERSTGLASAWLPVTNAPGLTTSNTWAIALPPEPGTRFARSRVRCSRQASASGWSGQALLARTVSITRNTRATRVVTPNLR